MSQETIEEWYKIQREGDYKKCTFNSELLFNNSLNDMPVMQKMREFLFPISQSIQLIQNIWKIWELEEKEEENAWIQWIPQEVLRDILYTFVESYFDYNEYCLVCEN